MEIQLNKKYYLLGDSRQWILGEKRTGEDRIYHIGFYVELKYLLQDYVNMCCRTKKSIKTIAELLKYQKELVGSLCKALRPLEIEVKPLK
ncbi:hypothetical protein KAU11_10810 [Candidatus Babeliales bacterium]|nr:hypothetical protein [Candidatus Babeliales bacterium]